MGVWQGALQEGLLQRYEAHFVAKDLVCNGGGEGKEGGGLGAGRVRQVGVSE